MARLDPLSVLGPGGKISALLAGYETRDEQLRMAKAVPEAIESGTHLMVEAGTGVGKSFAYLVPAILAATDMGKRVVVSTRTINLQNQLIAKDIPFLRAAMPQEFQAVLVKGRSNFISLRRLDSALARAGASSGGGMEFEQLSALAPWVGTTKDGSRADLNFPDSIELQVCGF
jgi:ATP-dependent DNA helicase DinG